MKFNAFDLETTGTDPATARIVTFSVITMDDTGPLESIDGIIDPGVEIPEGAAAVHGVTTERARAEGQDPKEVLPLLVAVLNRPTTPILAFNARYDLTVLAHELRRHGMDHAWIANRQVIDPLVIDKEFDKFRRGKRTLAGLCKHYGITVENAHTADADALAAGLLFQALRKKCRRELPVDSQSLHNAQIYWAGEQAASLQAYFRRTNPQALVEPRWPFYVTEEAAS